MLSRNLNHLEGKIQMRQSQPEVVVDIRPVISFVWGSSCQFQVAVMTCFNWSNRLNTEFWVDSLIVTQS